MLGLNLDRERNVILDRETNNTSGEHFFLKKRRRSLDGSDNDLTDIIMGTTHLQDITMFEAKGNLY